MTLDRDIGSVSLAQADAYEVEGLLETTLVPRGSDAEQGPSGGASELYVRGHFRIFPGLVPHAVDE